MEPAASRWARRALTVPATFVVLLVLTALAPVVIPPLALADVVLRRRFASVRFVVALVVVAGMECLGIIAALGTWLGRGGIEADFSVQRWWTNTLFRATSRVLGVRFELVPLSERPQRPLILLVRHASVIDTLFPAIAVSIPHRLRLRYLLKHQLAWDPCIDIFGQRLENVFVRRSSRSPGEDLAIIAAMATDLSAGLGVVVFPEGTRFSPARRDAAIERLRAQGDQRGASRAQALTRVLPPRSGGVLALLDGAPTADVAFLAHTGLEDARTLADLWSGRLIGRTVRATSWQVARADIPAETQQRIAWLHEQWARVDAWIAAEGEPAPLDTLAGDAPASRYAGA